MNSAHISVPKAVTSSFLLVTGISVTLIRVLLEAYTFQKIGKLSFEGPVDLIGEYWVYVCSTAAFIWLAIEVLREEHPQLPDHSNRLSMYTMSGVNCLLAIFLALGVLSILFTLNDVPAIFWAHSGVPGLLIKAGWSNTSTFFVYDTVRFCLFSFLAVWPVTMLRPQKPVLYSLAVMFALIILLRYWTFLTSWVDLPSRALWTPWLVLIHILSVPAMYQMHIKLRGAYNKPLNSDASKAGAG